MKIGKRIETTEIRQVEVKKWVTVTEPREFKVQKWIEVEEPCANPECKYPDAPHYAKGFCQRCYLARRGRIARGTDSAHRDTIEGLQAELDAVQSGQRLPEGLYERMKKLGIENFKTSR